MQTIFEASPPPRHLQPQLLRLITVTGLIVHGYWKGQLGEHFCGYERTIQPSDEVTTTIPYLSKPIDTVPTTTIDTVPTTKDCPF